LGSSRLLSGFFLKTLGSRAVYRIAAKKYGNTKNESKLPEIRIRTKDKSNYLKMKMCLDIFWANFESMVTLNYKSPPISKPQNFY
jgi:hypothetical protein